MFVQFHIMAIVRIKDVNDVILIAMIIALDLDKLIVAIQIVRLVLCNMNNIVEIVLQTIIYIDIVFMVDVILQVKIVPNKLMLTIVI